VADSIADFKVLAQPFLDGVVNMQKRTDRATMWALREVGRQMKRQARARAPVYRGRSGARVQFKNFAQFRRFQKATKYRGSVASSVVVPGLLKNSISSSRRLQSVKTGEYSLKVGPRGQRVHLYAGKVEARTPYMKPAYDEVAARMGAVAAGAWGRAMARGS
jgi:hypothetical protein